MFLGTVLGKKLDLVYLVRGWGLGMRLGLSLGPQPLLEPYLLLGRMAASHHSTSGISSTLPSLLGPRSASLVAEDMPVLRATEAMLE